MEAGVKNEHVSFSSGPRRTPKNLDSVRVQWPRNLGVVDNNVAQSACSRQKNRPLRGQKRHSFSTITSVFIRENGFSIFEGQTSITSIFFFLIQLCVYVCIYVCMYVYMYVAYVCLHGCIYVCMYVCIYVCMYVCIYVCMYICMHVCMYICMHGCIYVCMYVCMHVCM